MLVEILISFVGSELLSGTFYRQEIGHKVTMCWVLCIWLVAALFFAEV